MFIVIYDDGAGFIIPQQWDADCEGAIHSWLGGDPVAVFSDRKAARKAIAVSEAWNRLLKTQGETFNDDFTDPKLRKRLKVVALKGAVTS